MLRCGSLWARSRCATGSKRYNASSAAQTRRRLRHLRAVCVRWTCAGRYTCICRLYVAERAFATYIGCMSVVAICRSRRESDGRLEAMEVCGVERESEPGRKRERRVLHERRDRSPERRAEHVADVELVYDCDRYRTRRSVSCLRSIRDSRHPIRSDPARRRTRLALRAMLVVHDTPHTRETPSRRHTLHRHRACWTSLLLDFSARSAAFPGALHGALTTAPFRFTRGRTRGTAGPPRLVSRPHS